MKIFVTGGTGYIGEQLLLKLTADGFQVNAVARNLIEKELTIHKNLKWFEGNMLDFKTVLNAMDGCDAVIHGGGYARPWSRDSKVYYSANVLATDNILRGAKELDISKVIVTSTSAVFQNSGSNPVTENDIPSCSFAVDYQQSKFMLEWLVQRYALKGLNVVILNPSRVFGPGKLTNCNFTIVIKKYLNSRIIFVPTEINSLANYVYIDDLIDAYQKAIVHGVSGERYIIGGDNISYRELFQTLQQLTRKRPKIIAVPKPLLFGWALTELWRGKLSDHEPRLTPQWLPLIAADRVLDNSKARQQLHWTPLSFSAGALKTIRWLIENDHVQKKDYQTLSRCLAEEIDPVSISSIPH